MSVYLIHNIIYGLSKVPYYDFGAYFIILTLDNCQYFYGFYLSWIEFFLLFFIAS